MESKIIKPTYIKHEEKLYITNDLPLWIASLIRSTQGHHMLYSDVYMPMP